MVDKVILGGCYSVLGGYQSVAMRLIGCCELLPGCIQLISCSECFNILLCSC